MYVGILFDGVISWMNEQVMVAIVALEVECMTTTLAYLGGYLAL